MRRNDEIQAAILAYIKTVITITAEVTVIEMREDQFQGEDYTYPNIRIRLISNNPLNDDPSCSHQNVTFSIMVFSEDASSLEADRIAGIINTALHGKSIISNSISFFFRTTNLVPAIRQDKTTWRSEVLMLGIASG
jgi:hypothetical protein